MKILKYKLNAKIIAEPQPVSMPVGAKILDAQFQNGELVVWAEVRPRKPSKTKLFTIIFTGSNKPSPVVIRGPGVKRSCPWTHVSTLQHGNYTLHIYVGPDLPQ